jgi:hypothetical protein
MGKQGRQHYWCVRVSAKPELHAARGPSSPVILACPPGIARLAASLDSDQDATKWSEKRLAERHILIGGFRYRVNVPPHGRSNAPPARLNPSMN